MKKQYYDHRTKQCPGCAFHQPEGERPESRISNGETWPEGCGLYGYLFHKDRYPEDADSCEGFETPARFARRMEMMREAKKKQQSKQ